MTTDKQQEQQLTIEDCQLLKAALLKSHGAFDMERGRCEKWDTVKTLKQLINNN